MGGSTRQERELLSDVYDHFREFCGQKGTVFKIGEKVMNAIDFNAVDLSRMAERWHILHAQPWDVTASGTASETVGDMPTDVSFCSKSATAQLDLLSPRRIA